MKYGLIITLSLLISSLSMAEEPGDILVGSIDQPPWAWIDSEGDKHGASVDFSKALCDQLEGTFTTKIRPYPRLVKSIENQKIHYAFFLQAQKPKLSTAVAKAIDVDVVLLSTKEIDTSDIFSLRHFRIGKIANGKYTDKVYSVLPSEFFTPLQSYKQGIELLQKNRLDGVMGLAASINEALMESSLPESSFIKKVIAKEEVWLYASQTSKNKAITEKIRAVVNTLREKGELKKMVIENHRKAAMATQH